MEHGWKHIVRQQFDASLDMLGRAIQACPATLWDDRERLPRFGELVYHALEVADRYLGRAGAEPALPEPFGRPADGSDQGAPERAFDREELSGYSRTSARRGRARWRCSTASADAP